MFAPVAPAEMLGRLRGRYNDPLDLLAEELPRLARPEETTPVLGIAGRAAVLDTARAIILGAASAIHASCWSADMPELYDAFAAAHGRGVAVWGMLYGPAEPPPGNWLQHSYEDIVERRVGGRMLSLVADGGEVMVARLPLDGEASAVRTAPRC